MPDTAKRDTTIRRNVAFEFALDKIRRGLTEVEKTITAASVRFETTEGIDRGGPYPCVYDVEAAAWVAQCPARTENVGTVLVSIASFTSNAVQYEQRGTLRITA